MREISLRVRAFRFLSKFDNKICKSNFSKIECVRAPKSPCANAWFKLQLQLTIRKMYVQRQFGYAPTPYSYTPTPTLTASINLDEVWPPNSLDVNCKLSN